MPGDDHDHGLHAEVFHGGGEDRGDVHTVRVLQRERLPWQTDTLSLADMLAEGEDTAHIAQPRTRERAKNGIRLHANLRVEPVGSLRRVQVSGEAPSRCEGARLGDNV